MDPGEVDARAAAALDLAGTHVFGTEPGRIPVLLNEAYEATDEDRLRARLATALAHCWAYAGEHARAVPFAVAAVRHAESTGDQTLIADALDAALATHWGPDELELRVDLARRLDDVTAHVLDADSRTQAHIWLLSVAAEMLDVAEINRQMRALELLGEESPKARFYAASRRLMLDLMRGRTDTVEPLARVAEEALKQTALPDGFMVLYAMRGYGAVFSGSTDPEILAMVDHGAAMAESEGLRVLHAELAWIYLGLGAPAQARRMAATFDTRTLADLPRDLNYLLILQLLLDLALSLDAEDLVRDITPLLMPYAGRAVINAGAVMFHGVTDDTLARAAARQGDLERAAALREKAVASYRRIGATWWRERLEAAMPVDPSRARPRGDQLMMTLRPGPAGVWLVGRGERETAVPARRGLEHVHALLSRPGQEISALHLAGAGPAVAESSLGPVLDPSALAAYRRRLAEIDEELDEADAWADAGRAEKLGHEREALLAEVSAATGLAGRVRTVGASAERARVTVRKAISSAIEAVHAADPVVARHLTNRVRTGTSCSYDPDPDHPVTWRL